MIEKIINKYLSSTFIRCIKSWSVLYLLDVKIIPKNEETRVYVKSKKYHNGCFKNIFNFKNQDAILYLCNLTKAKEEIENRIKEYQKKEC